MDLTAKVEITVSELEDRPVEITQAEKQGKKDLKKKNLHRLVISYRQSDIYVIGVLEDKAKEQQKKYLGKQKPKISLI